MSKNRILFLTKDAMCRDYLPIYGNKFWRTPNIDELANKGTVFYRHYTGAASTIMSNMCMFTGQFTFENEMDDYFESNRRFDGETLFDKAEKLGYATHIIWDESWYSDKTVEYYDCYGKNTVFHSIKDMKQGVGGHYHREKPLEINTSKTEYVLSEIEKVFNSIINSTVEKVFVWLHIPHVINGSVCYGQDIEPFDEIVGISRKYFDDDSIYISADHGNMNGSKGKICYGFDVYDPIARIPLITPYIGDTHSICQLTSNVDIYSIIFEGAIPNREMVYCDTAFYAQAHRKIAIITQQYKYIYNKYSQKEELYDLEFDPFESCNLICDYVLDEERLSVTPLNEEYYYNNWSMLKDVRHMFREELKRIWRKGTPYQELRAKLRYMAKIYILVPRIRRKDKRLKRNDER